MQEALRNFARDLHAYLVSGARVDDAGARGGARPAAAPRGGPQVSRTMPEYRAHDGHESSDAERRRGRGRIMPTINTTPLVDVMLVLLIIFLITIPVVTHDVPGRAAARPSTSRRRPSRRTSRSRSTRTATSTGTSSRCRARERCSSA